jgi:integrase
MAKLTDVQLRAWIKYGKPIAGKSDGGGLTFTLSKAGTASWVVRYRLGGKQREITLGNYPDLSLTAARKKAAVERVRVDQGVHVASEKRKGKLDTARAGSFRALAEDYVQRSANGLSESTRKETRRYLDKDILTRLGSLTAREVSGGDIVTMVEKIAARSDSVARRAFEIVSVIYSHGVAKHLVKDNPCAGLKLSAILGKRQVHGARIKLTEDEVRAVLASLPSLGRINALAVKILLATCVRKGELIRAQWKHIDLKGAIWTVPDENSKTGKGFAIPLAPTVVDWFTELRDLARGSDWVLPVQMGPARRDRHINSATFNAALTRLDCKSRAFSPHDLRSTARSHLAALGVDVIVAERCLNHSLGGLVAVYDQHDYLTERRKALELWAAFLNEAEKARPWNVAPIQQSAA